MRERDGTPTSDYWLSLHCRETLQATAQPIAYDTTLTSQSCAPVGDVTAYQFTGTEGERIILRVEPSGVNTKFQCRLELYGPSDSLLVMREDTYNSGWPNYEYGGRQVSIVDYELPESGEYTIYVRERDGTPTSDYWLQLQAPTSIAAGQVIADRNLSGTGSDKYYRIISNSDDPVVVHIEKEGPWDATLYCKKGHLPVATPYDSHTGSGDLDLAFIGANPDTFYIRLVSNGGGGIYTLRTDRDLCAATQSLRIDNDFLNAKLSIPSSALTTLTAKSLSTGNLLKGAENKRLFDFRSDPQLGNHLASNWVITDHDVRPAHIRLALAHPSGFAKDLVFSWNADHLELRCDATIPESVQSCCLHKPGGDCDAEKDQWAFPALEGVQSGTFAYPSSARSLYPEDDQWGIPGEGWLAFWDSDEDVVYGYTYSGGFTARVIDGSGADLRFRYPVGQSRIAFHVMDTGGAEPTEALGALANGPFLVLQSGVDHRFVVPGDTLNYELTFANTGNETATATILETEVSEHLEILETSVPAPGVVEGNRINWSLGTLVPDSGFETLTFAAVVLPEAPDEAEISTTSRVWCDEQQVPTMASSQAMIGYPEIGSITPDVGGDHGEITVMAFGAHLDPNAIFKLRMAGEEDIVADPSHGPLGGEELTGTFDLHDAALGHWDVAITNPNGAMVILPEAFLVEESTGAEMWIEITGRNSIRPGRRAVFSIRYGNTGNVNGIGVPLWLSGIPIGSTIEPCFDLIPPVDPAVGDTTNWNAVPVTFESDGELVMPLLLPVVPSQSDGRLDFAITVPGSAGNFQLQAWTNQPLYNSPVSMEVVDCIKAIIELVVDLTPGHGCVVAALDGLYDTMRNASQGKVVSLRHTLRKILIDCIVGFIPGGPVIETILEMYKMASGGFSVLDECMDVFVPNGFSFIPVRLNFPIDPNEILGPIGFDPADTPDSLAVRHIAPGVMPYTIYFENLTTATAGAQEIQVTDQIPEEFDRSTFAFQEVRIGNREFDPEDGLQHFETTIDLRPDLSALVDITGDFDPTTGAINWLMRGRDPYTGELADILPPNTEETAPLGAGWVAFAVELKGDLETGAVITNQAVIDFEVGIPPEPLMTNIWLNTIDADAPEAMVLQLAEAQYSETFQLLLSGEDAGSGIGTYWIYASDNGGPYALRGMTDRNELSFTGEVGHTYSFYCLAEDHVGNLEDAIGAMAEATTTVRTPRQMAVAPNPFVPARGHTEMTFFGGDLEDGTVRIYNKAGALIQTLHVPADATELQWDGRSRTQVSLASGVYIWVLTTTDDKVEKGKFAIIR